jgi:hypothetical protein
LKKNYIAQNVAFKDAGKKSRFLLDLNEMPNEGGLVATDFVRLF